MESRAELVLVRDERIPFLGCEPVAVNRKRHNHAACAGQPHLGQRQHRLRVEYEQVRLARVAVEHSRHHHAVVLERWYIE